MTPRLSRREHDEFVLDLCEQISEVEHRLIQTGLHVFGRAAELNQIADLLRMVASFDRPEHKCRALPEIISEALGFGPCAKLCAPEGEGVSDDRFRKLERVDAISRAAIGEFLRRGPSASVGHLSEAAGISQEINAPIFAFLSRLRDRLATNDEMAGLVKALEGRHVEPSHGADIIQNPEIIPTGRNLHAVNPHAIPSAVAVQRARPVAEALLERQRRETGRYPESIAMVLWGLDNIKIQGEAVAQALWLLGVEPRRDALYRVSSIDVVPLKQLGRPRIDVVMTVSGIFRDLFAPTVSVLDQAVRAVAALDEPHEMNFVKKHVDRDVAEGEVTTQEAKIRIFSNAAGNYGSNVNFMILAASGRATTRSQACS